MSLKIGQTTSIHDRDEQDFSRRQTVSIDIAKTKLVAEQAEKDEAYMRLKQRAAKLQSVAEAAEAYINEVDVPQDKLGELMDRLRDAGYQKDNCPSCGREKARSAQDVGDGKCPKWYAVRDPEAERDCTLYGGPK